jgi:hypothetical protein
MSPRYFQFLFIEDDRLGVAFAPGDRVRDDVFTKATPIAEWSSIAFELRDGAPADYQANDLGVRLCSEKLRRILDSKLAPNDSVQWLPARVRETAASPESEYFILHLPGTRDILDTRRSIFADDFIVKAVLRSERLQRHSVVGLPSDSPRFFVSDEVRASVEEAGCSGAEFAPAPIT